MSFQQLMMAAIITCSASQVQAASYCGNLNNAFGPFDYRKAVNDYPQQKLLVESAHFTPDVENLIKGSSSYLGGDLDYTLRAFPNHHRALASIAKLALKTKGTTVAGLNYSFDCYFERAMRFAPDDDGVYTVHGTYLFKRGDIAGATRSLSRALSINPDNAPANYNLGLIYLQQKRFDLAVPLARKAYSQGYPVQGLKNHLVAAGKWDGH